MIVLRREKLILPLRSFLVSSFRRYEVITTLVQVVTVLLGVIRELVNRKKTKLDTPTTVQHIRNCSRDIARGETKLIFSDFVSLVRPPAS